MRISKIKCNNFKSLVDFELPVAKFTCLVGLNGAGKSTVLQFVDFLSQLVRGRIDVWLEDRGWSARELRSGTCSSDLIEFAVELEDEAHGRFSWSGEFDTNTLRCTSESFKSPSEYLTVDNSGWAYHKSATAGSESGNDEVLRSLRFQGSLLSILGSPTVPASLMVIKDFFTRTHSLELLSPELMRSRPRQSSGSVGTRGEGLAAYIHEMSDEQRQRIIERLKVVYGQLESVQSKTLRAGWKQLSVNETFAGQSLQTDARHINDGMLRLMAIIAELESDHAFLLFDEIENGVNPELVKFLIDTLLEARQQILVTTHSPVVLNYLPDSVAREGMIYLFKTPEGVTKAVRFFDIARMAKKLTMMGPGEVFADTDLFRLPEEIESLSQGA